MMMDSLKRKNDGKPKGVPRRRWMIVLSLLMVLSGLALSVFAQHATEMASQPTGRLFYTSDGGHYILNFQSGERIHAESTGLISSTVYPDDAFSGSPVNDMSAWNPPALSNDGLSPDGTLIATWEQSGDTPYVYNLIIRQVTTDEVIAQLGPIFTIGSAVTWSPNNDFVLFSGFAEPVVPDKYFNHNSALWQFTIDTGNLKQLTDASIHSLWPILSPDGQYIAYLSEREPRQRLRVLNLQTGESAVLVPQIYSGVPSWSPDSEWIAFYAHKGDEPGSIWIVRRDGTDSQMIVSSKESAGNPVWVP